MSVKEALVRKGDRPPTDLPASEGETSARVARVPADAGLAIDFTSVADAHYEDDNSLILEVADDAVVADAVFPEAPQLGAFEGFTE